MSIKTGVGNPIQIGTFGTLTLASEKTAPLIICYGGASVNGVESGLYMYDYMDGFFNSIGDSYNLFILKNSDTNGNDAFKALDVELKKQNITPRVFILFLFSEGSKPGMELLSVKDVSTFDKIYLADIKLNVTEIAEFYQKAVTSNPSKYKYFYTTAGSGNDSARNFILSKLTTSYKRQPEVDAEGDHFIIVIDSINSLRVDYKPPFIPVSSPASSPTSTDTKSIMTTNSDNSAYGKLTIRKKSGPGEITGIVERNLENYGVGSPSATFDDIQFTEPGDYVIVITGNENIEPLELKVKVTKDDDFIEQPESKGSDSVQKPVDGTRPIIAQIDKPTIVVPPIKMSQDGRAPGAQIDYTEQMGYTPLIWYKSFAIEDRNLKYMRLYHEGILPKIEITFFDSKELMKSEVAPTNDVSIDLFLNSTSPNLKSIHMTFKIERFIQSENKPGQTYTIVGSINVPGLYVQNNKSYKDTSFNTLKKISAELGLGFNSNISNTNDNMSWRNTNKKPYEFIQDIISRSYISDESFTGGYIDYYYCFNYVDIEKEMNRDASNDVGIESSQISDQSKIGDDNRIIPLLLSNDKSYDASCCYIQSFTKINDSTAKSLKKGYATITKTYDRISKQFLVFKVDSTTSDGSESIILKGGINDDSYQNENVINKFTGKLDTDNVHKDYNYAITQNNINLDKLNNVAINATLPQANWNLYKYQKIKVHIINDTQTLTNTSIVDWRYSGYYIIADIEYFWDGKRLSQDLRLIRKELGKTPDEIKNDPPQKVKTDSKENNENPVTASLNKPNSVYEIGEKYTVKDKLFVEYELTITQIMSNGKEVIGTLKKKV